MSKDKNRPKLPLFLRLSASIISLGIKNNWFKNRLSTFVGFPLCYLLASVRDLYILMNESEYFRPTVNDMTSPMRAEEDRANNIWKHSRAYLGCDILGLLTMGKTRCGERQCILSYPEPTCRRQCLSRSSFPFTWVNLWVQTYKSHQGFSLMCSF